MHSTQIRTTFFDYFTARDHRQVPSSPLIPSDPTLLLANAGMNQFKPYFLGETEPEYPRATSVQKCARTSDIDNVGRTTRHATFFEMLGNFSFGDYFKPEAIAYAHDLLTTGYGLDPDRLWITVYLDDDEAQRHWLDLGIPLQRIQRLGMEDNYWSMGVPGPCGPSSEVCYDRGPAFGPDGGPEANGERYLEIWNLVFMQNLRGDGPAKTDYPILGELPSKNIDTGLGLDRLAMILQDVENVSLTDLLAPTLVIVQDLAGRAYPDSGEEKVSFQVVTEHARSIAFLIADGVLPAKDGRGYILRRLMRRALRHARLLGITGQVLAPVTGSVIENLSDTWPELSAHACLIEQVVAAEEESFTRTLNQGSRLLDAAVRRARETKSAALPGETAFELHDTFGFPVELTVEAAREAGLSVDEDRFAALLAEQQLRAQSGGKAKTAAMLRRMDAYRQLAVRHGRTEFVGYDDLTSESTILALIDDGNVVQAAGERREVEVVLDRSPFYAESGGQVGDTGTLTTPDGAVLTVIDTRLGLEGFHIHTAQVTAGEARTGQHTEAQVDRARRQAVTRSHSATHVLHAMLRRIVGDHARQHGSLVDAGRLRFDFAHICALDHTQLSALETLVNDHLLDDPDVRIWHASRAEAEAAGATALFGEKYGETVRIVDIGDFSRELCGGTHVAHGSGAGPVRILGESSIGANLRRIEALTGRDALRFYDRERALLREVADLLAVRPADVPQALRTRLETLAGAQAELGALRQRELAETAARIAAGAEPVATGWLATGTAEDVTADELRALAADVLSRLPARPGIAILAATRDGKALLAAAVTRDLLDTGTEARRILTRAARAIRGGAGGKGALANAGGRDTDQLASALAIAQADARAELDTLG